jgi:hypothetical protein
MRNLFGGLPHFSGHKTFSSKGDDCGFLGVKGQACQQS